MMMLTAPTLALPGIRHAFFTRQGGVSTGLYASLNGGIGSADAIANVDKNRARMATALGVEPHCLVSVFQIHSPQVIVAKEPWPAGLRPRADGIVTRARALAIGVTTADCGPVLFAEPQAGVIGVAHAGWRGALAGIVEATVAAMQGLGAARDQIRAALGPMIRQRHYEVGPDLIERFAVEDPAAKPFFAPAVRPGHAMFDLAGYIATRLRRAEVDQVDDLDACTYGNPELFFSYRRATHRGEADYGRHVNAIALVGE